MRGDKRDGVERVGCKNSMRARAICRQDANFGTPHGAGTERRFATLVERHRPDAVALEESFVGRDARGALSVGQVRGALLVACARAGVPCAEYPPETVRQAVCGYGRADKAQVQRMAKALLGLERTPTPTHAADALAVSLCHATAPALLRLAG
jgi:crossover junction endodeoxyribonuclease RuvC